MSDESPTPDANAGTPNINQPGQPPNIPPAFGVPGQAPPAYLPPGYVPPGYPYIPPMLPSPREYAVRPDVPGQPWVIMPPRQGNLFQAWLSIATNFSRHNIAAWAQGSKRGWITLSMATAGIFVVVVAGLIILAASRIVSVVQAQVPSANGAQVANIVHPLFFVVAATVPLLYIGGIFVVAWFWALFMPPALGTVRQRLRRALLPYALTLPISSFIEFVLVGTSALFAFIALNANPNYFTTFHVQDLIFIVPWLLSLLAGIYSYVLIIQSGAVGSSLNRWAVFGIYYLASFAIGIAADLIFVPVSLYIVFSQMHP